MLVSDEGFQYLAAVMPAMRAKGVEYASIATNEFTKAVPGAIPRRFAKYYFDGGALRAFRAQIAAFAPDVIHAMGVRSVLMKTLAATRAFPAVAIVHERISAGGMNPLNPVDPMLFGSSRIDRIVMPSRAMLNNWMGNSYTRKLARPERCEVLHYAFDLPPPTTREERRALRGRLGLDPDAFIIGTVCYIRPWKNVEFAAEVVTSLDTVRPVFLAVVGGASRDAAYMDKIRAAAGGRLKLLGHIPDAHRMMAAFDLYLTPTRLPGESFGMAFAEAMAHGVPGITMNYGASAEVCEHGVTGFALPESARVWRRHIEELMRDSASLARMGEAARKRIADRFSPAARAEDYFRVYATVIEERGRQGRSTSAEARPARM
jgi:glycosyltransferase involved in cell wall biosynthesis